MEWGEEASIGNGKEVNGKWEWAKGADEANCHWDGNENEDGNTTKLLPNWRGSTGSAHSQIICCCSLKFGSAKQWEPQSATVNIIDMQI
jgi:hypothetical protein